MDCWERGHDWALTAAPSGWAVLLRKPDRTVRQAVRDSSTGKVTLVGHSLGGLLARLYLSPTPFPGYAFRELDYIDHLSARVYARRLVATLG